MSQSIINVDQVNSSYKPRIPLDIGHLITALWLSKIATDPQLARFAAGLTSMDFDFTLEYVDGDPFAIWKH